LTPAAAAHDPRPWRPRGDLWVIAKADAASPRGKSQNNIVANETESSGSAALL